MKYKDLEYFKNKNNNPILNELISIGQLHLEEKGIDLLNQVMFTRGLTYKEIEEYCGIQKGLLEKSVSKGVLSKDLIRKLNKMGFKF